MREPLILATNHTLLVTASAPPLSESEKSTPVRKFRILALAVELAIGMCGVALMGLGVGANRRWLDRHVLPSFLLSREMLVAIETMVRGGLAAAGASLVVFVRPAAGRALRSAPVLAVTTAAAIVLAIVASEPLLRRVEFRPVGWLSADDEPRRQVDARLGWTLVPSRVGHASVGGRTIDYITDANGYRVGAQGSSVDRAQHTMLFVGESVMFGEGLTWDESIPAQAGAIVGIQSANLAVHGFGNDQAFLRLQAELPRFERPVAIVSLFMPTLFGRNLDHERPHLAAGLAWQPADLSWRVQSLLRLMVPYHRTSTIEHGIALTREIFGATNALARARGAVPLVVMPQFGPESEPESVLRRRVLTGIDVPSLVIQVDPAWRLPWDRHPDARAAHAIAVAIANRLQSEKNARAR